MTTRKGKHLSDGQRVTIESMLNNKEPIRAIARVLGKAPSTISREIRKHAEDIPARANDCAYKKECGITRLCSDIPYCASKCSKKCPGKCTKLCRKYEPAICTKLLEPPYVCNSCGGFHGCSYNKRIYKAKSAHEAYEREKTESRSGAYTTDEELQNISDLIRPRLQKGQSLYHILNSDDIKDKIDVSIQTLYDWVEKCLIPGVDPVMLPRQLRRKRRIKHRNKKLHNESKYMTTRKEGRLYSDYLKYIEENDVPPAVQMDCIEGKADEKPVILTLHYPDLGMQLGFLLKEHTTVQVVRTFNILERVLGTEMFQQVFPLILTDNGHEFSDIEGMETSCLDPSIKRTKVFFCEPNRSDQKGSCENNHSRVRKILPKGTSFRYLTQEDVRLVFNHINSQRREKTRKLSAYDIAFDRLPKEFFTKLGLVRIPDDEVTLMPYLITTRVASRVIMFDERNNMNKK